MKSTPLKFVLCLLTLSHPALAGDLEMQFNMGYGYGAKLEAENSINVSNIPLGLGMVYEDSLFGYVDYGAGAVFQHAMVSYKDEGSSYEGQNVLMGARVEWQLYKGGNTIIRLGGDYFVYNTLNVTTDSQSTVNSNSFKHSALTTYSGSGATEVFASYVREVTSGQFNKRERLRYGVRIGQFTQPISKKVVVVDTSNPDLDPRTRTETTVDYSLSSLNITLTSGFAF
jgi:hypothetical protein